MKRANWQWGWIAIAVVWSAGLAPAAVQYEQAQNRIWITDYPEAMPCTLERLLVADQAFGWNKIRYDESQAAYWVDADVCIGTDDGSETYVQMGASNVPRTTVILNGNLFVCPGRKDEKTGRTCVNRLTLGYPADTNGSVILKVASEKGNEHSVYVGVRPEGKHAYSRYNGQLHMFHSEITALIQDAEHALGAPFGQYHLFLTGDSIHIKNSAISWVKRCLAYGLVMHLDTRIENTVFAHGRKALARYKETSSKNNLVTGCTFRDCETALDSPNHLVVLTGCRFERNQRNWVMNNCKELTLIDCEIEPPLKGNEYGRTDYAKKRGWHPQVVIKRHVVVAVRDEAGQPVENAVVTVRERLNGKRLEVATGKDGSTGGEDSGRGLLLVERIERVMEGSDQPEVLNFIYDIHVKAEGFNAGEKSDYRPQTNWERVVVTLVKTP